MKCFGGKGSGVGWFYNQFMFVPSLLKRLQAISFSSLVFSADEHCMKWKNVKVEYT